MSHIARNVAIVVTAVVAVKVVRRVGPFVRAVSIGYLSSKINEVVDDVYYGENQDRNDRFEFTVSLPRHNKK